MRILTPVLPRIRPISTSAQPPPACDCPAPQVSELGRLADVVDAAAEGAGVSSAPWSDNHFPITSASWLCVSFCPPAVCSSTVSVTFTRKAASSSEGGANTRHMRRRMMQSPLQLPELEQYTRLGQVQA